MLCFVSPQSSELRAQSSNLASDGSISAGWARATAKALAYSLLAQVKSIYEGDDSGLSSRAQIYCNQALETYKQRIQRPLVQVGACLSR